MAVLARCRGVGAGLQVALVHHMDCQRVVEEVVVALDRLLYTRARSSREAIGMAKEQSFSTLRARCIPLLCVALLVLLRGGIVDERRTVSLAGLHLLYYWVQGWIALSIRLAMPER